MGGTLEESLLIYQSGVAPSVTLTTFWGTARDRPLLVCLSYLSAGQKTPPLSILIDRFMAHQATSKWTIFPHVPLMLIVHYTFASVARHQPSWDMSCDPVIHRKVYENKGTLDAADKDFVVAALSVTMTRILSARTTIDVIRHTLWTVPSAIATPSRMTILL